MTVFKAIIFDLDGTLLDTLEDISFSVNRILKNRNLPEHNLESYKYFIGDGVTKLIERALPAERCCHALIDECVKDFQKEYGRNWDVKTKPYEGTTEILRALDARNIKIAVLSNKPHEYTQKCVEKYFPDIDFSVVLGQKNDMPQKPDPAGAFYIAKKIGLTPDHILYAGDTAVDMKTAINAGMFPVGVLWGFRSEKELTDNGAKALIDNPLQILGFLDIT